MKTLRTLLMAIAMLLCSTTVSAHDFEVDGIYYNILRNESPSVEVTYKDSNYMTSNAYSGKVIVPSSVEYNGITYSVTNIGSEAFYGCTELTDITIPNSVAIINYSTFYGCTGLTDITIPNSVTSIEVSAFCGCTGLTDITIPNSVTSVAASAFEGCTGLTNITIPNSVTSIDGTAFSGCTGLPVEGYVRYADTWVVGVTDSKQTSYTLRDNTVGLCQSVFKDCINLINIAIPNSVTIIGPYAFRRCTGLMDITIPNSVTNIGPEAFYGCTALTDITLPNSMTSINYSVFEGCTALTDITIPNSVTSIEKDAFSGCINLSSVTIESQSVASMRDLKSYFGNQVTKYIIGNDVTSIDSYTFSGCTALTDITIPNSVTNIGSSAFKGCTGLTDITIPSSVTSIGYSAFSDCTGLTDINIPNSVVSIGDFAFKGCTGLTNITIPNSVTSFGTSAFEGCTNLSTVTIETQSVASMCDLKSYFGEQVTTYIIGDEVTSIGNAAFLGCAGLTRITIPNSVTSIGNEAFSGCIGFTNITIPNSVTNIGSSAFKDCTGLTNITIPNSVTSIGSYSYPAFKGCTNLFTVTIESQSVASMRDLKSYFGEQVTTYIIGDGVTSIGNSAFDGCTNLTNITISESVSSIEVNAFKDCTNLPVENYIRYADTWAVGVTDKTRGRYTLQENTRGLAGGTFSDCTSFKSLVLPEGVISIGEYAFNNCTNLSNINIPSGVSYIGEYAFYKCALTEVSIPKGITEIMNYSFHSNNFSTVEIPEGVTSIGNNAFSYCSKLKSVNLPQSLTHIMEDAFSYCYALSSITIPENVTSIGSSAFTNLKSVTLNSPTILSEGGFTDKFGNYVTEYVINADAEEIKDYAFYNSTALQSITLPETLISIGEGAFENCTQLDSVRIPLNVATIKDYAFSCCTGLKYLACNAPVPPTCGTDAFAEVNTAECTLEVPDTVASIYATTAPWSSFNIKAVETPKEEIITRVDLVDGEVFENAEEAIMETITYTRTLGNLKWNALYVPFEIPMDSLIENYDIAYINAMHSYDMDDNGAIDKMEMEVVKIKEGTLHANYPYLIRAKNEEAKAMEIVVENSTLYAAENVTVDCSSVFTKFEITGTYQPLTNEEIAGCYALSGGTWKTMKDDATLNPFRLYMRISDREGSPVKVDTYALEQTSVTIRVQGENPGTTSIESKEIGVKSEESDATIYNLMGQPVNNPVKGHIYIQGGRKVVW